MISIDRRFFVMEQEQILLNMDKCCRYKLNYKCNQKYKLYIRSLFVIIRIDKQKMIIQHQFYIVAQFILINH